MVCQFLRAAAWLALAAGASLQAATYEVAQRNPQASDDREGTREQPFKTIHAAAAKVRPGDTVVIRDGVYREEVVLKTSGTETLPLRFESAPGAHVVLTGLIA